MHFSSDNVMRIIDIVENLLVREISLISNRSNKSSEIWFSSITIVAVDVLCVGGKIIAILNRRPWYVLFLQSTRVAQLCTQKIRLFASAVRNNVERVEILSIVSAKKREFFYEKTGFLPGKCSGYPVLRD